MSDRRPDDHLPDLPDVPDGPDLRQAAQAVLEPLARLAVARGLPFAVLEEAMKRAVVDAAARAHPELAPHRRVSRIATATGLNRREVTRLVQHAAPARARPRSLASEVFAHWQGTPAYRDAADRPRELPRQGPAPSFESLAQAVTRDVHPRSLLAELLRLKLAAHDPESDTVTLLREGFVPGNDPRGMLRLLGDNVGDHFSAAVDNVLGDGHAHFEQAVFADGLSPASLHRLRGLIGAEWQRLLQAFVPVLERMVEADAAMADAADARRVRIGLYAYDAAAAPDAPADPADPADLAADRPGASDPPATPTPAGGAPMPRPPRRRRTRSR